ncbi:MAG: hypothetical protein QW088_07505 [Desulfurococcaceae archaeon]
MSEEEIRNIVRTTSTLNINDFVKIIDEIVEFIESLDKEETRTLIKVLVEELEKSIKE